MSASTTRTTGSTAGLRAGAVEELTIEVPDAAIEDLHTRLSKTRWADDFPAGGGRFVVDSTGYRASVVNGAVLFDDGVDRSQ